MRHKLQHPLLRELNCGLLLTISMRILIKICCRSKIANRESVVVLLSTLQMIRLYSHHGRIDLENKPLNISFTDRAWFAHWPAMLELADPSDS